YAANTGRPAPNMHRNNILEIQKHLLEGKNPEQWVRVEHEPLVEFFSFALIGDHYHLGVVPTAKEALVRYMHKLNLGFAKYYNLKHGRRGSLFETRFQASSVRTPQHLKSLAHHINIKSVLDLYQPDWQTKGLNDQDDAVRFLHEYPYSSFPDIFRDRGSVFIPLSSRNELRKFIKIKGEKKEIVEIANEYILKQDSIDIR
ncbi:MAG: hypothetical protein Q8O97_00660, partial [bacterium]|nr:hypothetical protein [bacterium]